MQCVNAVVGPSDAQWETQHAINTNENWGNEFLLALLMTPMEFFTAHNMFAFRLPVGQDERANAATRTPVTMGYAPFTVISMVDRISLINITFQQSIYCPDLVASFYCYQWVLLPPPSSSFCCHCRRRSRPPLALSHRHTFPPLFCGKIQK